MTQFEETTSSPLTNAAALQTVIDFCSHEERYEADLRVSSDAKRDIEAIAAAEGRSAGQICEAFLKAGTETYKKRGARFLKQFLTKTT